MECGQETRSHCHSHRCQLLSGCGGDVWGWRGGMDEWISGKSDRKQPMRSDTNLLEFGKYIIVIIGSHSHTDMCVCWYAELQQSGDEEQYIVSDQSSQPHQLQGQG